jgi:hypothetical protein
MINLDIDDLSRTEDGRRKIAKAIAFISTSAQYRDDERTSWQYYYGKQSANAYDYLLKEGDYVLPAKPRFFPVQRTYINLLASTYQLRPFVYSVNACNRDAVKEKYENRIKSYVGEMMTRAKNKRASLDGTLESLQMKMQQLEQFLQQEPQNEEHAAQLQQIAEIMPMIKAQIIGAMDTVKTEELFTRSEIEKIERYYTYNKKEVVEELAQKAAKKLRVKHNMDRKGVENFLSKIVGGRAFYYVDYDLERNKLIYETVNSLKVTYPDIENEQWTHRLPWVKVSENMSPDAIISTYGHKLSKEEISRIRAMKPEGGTSSSESFLALPGGFVMDMGANASTTDTNAEIKQSGNGVKVEKIWWTAQREIVAVQSPNPHKDSNFTHFIPDDRIAIPSDEYTYNKTKKAYVHKKDESKTIEKDRAILVRKEKGEKIVKRYVDDRYKAIVINNEIVISEKDPVQPRSNDDYQSVPLPIVGYTYNGITNLPYSLMMITKGLADTYNLLHLHREIILALSGVAGILIDMSQKPAGMQKEEWFHQMKMGRYLIETVKEGRQVSSFNQFNRFDMSFSASIQYIDNMIVQTEQAIGDIIGISPPRKGAIGPHDQVGTQQQSKVQSELRTEIYFSDYEEIEREAFSMLVNLYAKYVASEGDIIELIGEDLSYEYGEIPKGLMDKNDYSVMLAKNSKHEEALRDIKMKLMQYSDQGRLPIHAFVKAYFAESIVELTKLAEYYDRNMAEAMEQSQQNQMQSQQQMEQMKAELQMQLKQIEAQLKEKDMQLKASIEESKVAVDKAKLEFEQRKWDDEKQLKLMEIVNEDKIETAVIDENREGRKADQQLKALQTKLDTIFKMLQLQLQAKADKDDHQEALKKISVDKSKSTNKMTKEHVRDN